MKKLFFVDLSLLSIAVGVDPVYPSPLGADNASRRFACWLTYIKPRLKRLESVDDRQSSERLVFVCVSKWLVRRNGREYMTDNKEYH